MMGVGDENKAVPWGGEKGREGETRSVGGRKSDGGSW